MDKPYLDTYYKLWYKDGLTMRDIVPKEIAELSNEHWLSQPPSHPFIVDLVGILFAVLTCVNLLGNGTTVYLYIKEKSLRRPSNLLVLNLAISDMVMIITNGIPLTLNIFYSNFWMYGKTMCIQYGLWGGITGLCSLWTLVFIGYDRYNTIVGGFTSKPFTNCKAMAAIIFCWGYPVAVLIWPTLEIWSKWSLEGLFVTCSFEYTIDTWWNKSYTIFIFSFCYAVPLVAIMFYYTFIVKAVWAHEAAMKEQAKKMNVESLRNDKDNEESAEVKIAKVAVTNVVLWYLTWTPYAAVCMYGQFGNRKNLGPVISQLPSMMAKTVSCLNPIVFAAAHPKFREAMGKHISFCKSEVGNSDAQSAAVTTKAVTA